MLDHCSRHSMSATLQGAADDATLGASRLYRGDFNAKVLERAPLTLEEVADFLELESSPESRHWAARALDYATALDDPLDRMAGLTLARAWLAATPPACLRRPVGRLRLHRVTGG